MTRLVRLFFAIGWAVVPIWAQDKIDGFEARLYLKEGEPPMPYRLFVPERYDKRRKYPLILWLHGGGGAGEDNIRQITGDQVPGTRLWTTPPNETHHPAFVVAPQSTGAWTLAVDTGLSQQLRAVLGILETVRGEFHIDSKRIYVAGQSLGGFGTWGLITGRPDLFAAAIVVCNSGSFPGRAALIRRLPVWVFQGDADNPVFVRAARDMVEAIVRAGGKPRYTEYKGAGHAIWERAFGEPMLASWMFGRHK